MTVVNRSEKGIDGNVAVDFAALGLQTPTVTNAESGEAIETADGRIPVAIPYHDFVLLSVEEGKGEGGSRGEQVMVHKASSNP
jgi:hypothetical protein